MYMYIASYHIIYVYNIIYVYIIYHNMYISMYVPPSLVGRCSWEELGRAEKLLAGLGNEFLGGLEKITLANATSL